MKAFRLPLPVLALFIGLLLPLSPALAASGNYSPSTPLGTTFDFSVGTKLNPLQVYVQPTYRSYCNLIPGFANNWFRECGPQVAQKELQTTLQLLSDNIYEQNKRAKQLQQWAFLATLKPAAPIVTPVVITQPAPPSSQVQAEVNIVTPTQRPPSGCDDTYCWGSGGGGSN